MQALPAIRSGRQCDDVGDGRQARLSFRAGRAVERSGPARIYLFHNYESRKGQELSENPQAAAVFYWPDLERQVCIAGEVTKLSQAESKAYFKTRPKGSQLAAWASTQSDVIPNGKSWRRNGKNWKLNIQATTFKCRLIGEAMY